MENIFTIAENCLYQDNVDTKIEMTHHAKKLFDCGKLSFQPLDNILPISQVKFPEKPLLLRPRDMPKRRLNSIAGKAAFFHALAHIEFVAVYLAWDIIYRFRNLPQKFYQDWLRVVDEEAQHFTLIKNHMLEMNVNYGDLPAHTGLWEHAEDTQADVLARLAIVPRCMEARGLDITPTMIEKFKAKNDKESVLLLARILKDEIGHVEIGSNWFKILCKQKNYDSEDKFKELMTKFYNGKPKGPFNRELRINAGFSNAEIDWLEENNE